MIINSSKIFGMMAFLLLAGCFQPETTASSSSQGGNNTSSHNNAGTGGTSGHSGSEETTTGTGGGDGSSTNSSGTSSNSGSTSNGGAGGSSANSGAGGGWNGDPVPFCEAGQAAGVPLTLHAESPIEALVCLQTLDGQTHCLSGQQITMNFLLGWYFPGVVIVGGKVSLTADFDQPVEMFEPSTSSLEQHPECASGKELSLECFSLIQTTLFCQKHPYLNPGCDPDALEFLPLGTYANYNQSLSSGILATWVSCPAQP